MRRLLLVHLMLTPVLAGCGSDQRLDHDLEPILLNRAPVEPGGAPIGALLAAVSTEVGIQPLLIDTAFPLNSLAKRGCVAGTTPGWTYTGDMQLRDGPAPSPLRAWFHTIGLFDICPGPVGDGTIQPAGVMGGPLLGNFSVGLDLPLDASETAKMTLWPSFPGTDDQLGQDGQVSLRFEARGNASAGKEGGEASMTLPSARIVLAACAAPRAFAITEPQEVCQSGEVALRATGQDLLLALGTGEGPLVLSESAWQSVAAQLGIAADAGTDGTLYTPFAAAGTPARFVDVPRLAVFQGTTDSTWLGACAELGRARRIEWAVANQDADAGVLPCFQPCDAYSGHSVSTRPYLELGGSLRAAVVSDASDVLRSLNSDSPPRPQVDGLIGAGTLAGTRLRLDYLFPDSDRVIASCKPGSTRETCWAAPSCPGFTDKNQNKRYTCFGMGDLRWAPVCP
jgi:hypothetical protein